MTPIGPKIFCFAGKTIKMGSLQAENSENLSDTDALHCYDTVTLWLNRMQTRYNDFFDIILKMNMLLYYLVTWEQYLTLKYMIAPLSYIIIL